MAVVIGDGLAIWAGTLFAVTPVGLAVGIAVASGIAAKIIYDSNFLGIKDMSKDWAQNFDEGTKKIGNAISNGWNSFKSCFSW